MSWSTPYTATAGTVLTAATWNAFVRDDLAYLMGLLDGTGSAIVTVPSDLRIANDANFYLNKLAGNPQLIFDTGDGFAYNRSTNAFVFVKGGATVQLNIDTDGKLTGAGFYSSGEFSLASTLSTTVSHGLADRPRFVAGYFWTATGSEASKVLTMQPTARVTGLTGMFIYNVSSTQISIQNLDGATRFCHVYAIL